MSEASQDSAILNTLLEAADDAIILSDQEGSILRVNRAAEQMFDHEATQMIGQRVNILMPNDVAARHDGFISRHIITGENRIIGIGRDVEGKRRDGSVFPLRLSMGETRVGKQSFFIAMMHDLTDRIATQEALARSHRLDAIGQMTGGIAHDFNTLLTVIIGNLELLELRSSAAGHAPLIRDALDAAQFGADLTSRLMAFARRNDLRPVAADLRVLCRQSLAMLQRTLGASCKIETSFADELDVVMVDPIHFQSTLMNLAFNARDAMSERGALLISIANVSIDDSYIAQETDIAPGDYVRLSVSDDGDGMSLEAQRRAFEPFFTTKADNGGTGLGLATVYGFVKQSGGHITLYSEPGIGSSFGLYFPALPSAIAHQDRSETPTPIKVSSPHRRGETILVVDDDARLRTLSIERLRNLGFATLEAENADRAYQILQEGAAVDLVFSDLVMPGTMNGYDLAEKIEQDFPALKILLTSGYASDAVTGRMTHGPKYEILHKPYRQSELSRRIHALLGDASDF